MKPYVAVGSGRSGRCQQEEYVGQDNCNIFDGVVEELQDYLIPSATNAPTTFTKTDVSVSKSNYSSAHSAPEERGQLTADMTDPHHKSETAQSKNM